MCWHGDWLAGCTSVRRVWTTSVTMNPVWRTSRRCRRWWPPRSRKNRNELEYCHFSARTECATPTPTSNSSGGRWTPARTSRSSRSSSSYYFVLFLVQVTLEKAVRGRVRLDVRLKCGGTVCGVFLRGRREGKGTLASPALEERSVRGGYSVPILYSSSRLRLRQPLSALDARSLTVLYGNCFIVPAAAKAVTKNTQNILIYYRDTLDSCKTKNGNSLYKKSHN